MRRRTREGNGRTPTVAEGYARDDGQVKRSAEGSAEGWRRRRRRPALAAKRHRLHIRADQAAVPPEAGLPVFIRRRERVLVVHRPYPTRRTIGKRIRPQQSEDG